MRTEVVETVTGRSMAELREARDRTVAALVELRLDGVADLDVAGALEGRRTPVIATCRPSWEGGRFDRSEEERLRILNDAARRGAEFVDVEWKADRRGLSVGDRTGVVLSHHDFSGVPDDIDSRVRAMLAERPAVVKLAVTPQHLSDTLRLRDLVPGGARHVVIGMGMAGRLTRVCPWLFGSCWTYGGAAAPGQLPAADLVEVYRVPAATAATKIYAVVGAPLAHSASPAMHNAALAAEGMDAVYLALETADADECLAVAGEVGVEGASVTAPLKETLFARTALVDDLSRQIGALNTLRRGPHGWEGRNFDVAGFLAPLARRAVPLAGARAVVLGAGGAARTAAWALASEGARVEISARHADRAARLAREFGVAAAAWPPAPGWDLLVNTTPVGTWPAVEHAPLSRDRVAGGRWVYDLVYNPEETTLLRWAREAGAEGIGGLEMLVGQACHQFEWWTGRPAPAGIIERAARAFVAGAAQRSA